MDRLRLALVAGTLALAGCGSPPGTRPHDMSAAGHIVQAEREEAEAARHQAQYDPTAETQDSWRSSSRWTADLPPLCYTPYAGTSPLNVPPLCWTSIVNPTEQHLRDAGEHRRLAAEHRAAARALRDAEEHACRGISAADRDVSPFYHRDDIERIEPTLSEKGARGALIVFHPVPGMTTERLQRIVDCHIARNAILRSEAMAYCPLALADIVAEVVRAGDRIAVRILSDDAATADQILERALRLAAP